MNAPNYGVIAFYTGKDGTAHISFVDEANRWFPRITNRQHMKLGLFSTRASGTAAKL
jgi:hypothetical protein